MKRIFSLIFMIAALAVSATSCGCSDLKIKTQDLVQWDVTAKVKAEGKLSGTIPYAGFELPGAAEVTVFTTNDSTKVYTPDLVFGASVPEGFKQVGVIGGGATTFAAGELTAEEAAFVAAAEAQLENDCKFVAEGKASVDITGYVYQPTLKIYVVIDKHWQWPAEDPEGK